MDVWTSALGSVKDARLFSVTCSTGQFSLSARFGQNYFIRSTPHSNWSLLNPSIITFSCSRCTRTTKTNVIQRVLQTVKWVLRIPNDKINQPTPPLTGQGEDTRQPYQTRTEFYASHRVLHTLPPRPLFHHLQIPMRETNVMASPQ